MGNILYHMLPAEDWAQAQVAGSYEAESLHSEGFIHCSGTPEVVVQVANRLYRRLPGAWLVLLLDEAAIAAPVRWDAVEDTHFPHIYGALNLDAVKQVIPFPRDAEGNFLPLTIPV